MADLDAVKVVSKTVTIPEHIEYPEYRRPIEQGLIKKGYRIRINFKVLDDLGNVVVDDPVQIIKFPEYPTDSDVVGVLKVSFNETPKVSV